MKVAKYLIMGAAFLMVVSSALTLFGSNTDAKTIVYVNMGAMVCLIATITFMNFDKKPKK